MASSEGPARPACWAAQVEAREATGREGQMLVVASRACDAVASDSHPSFPSDARARLRRAVAVAVTVKLPLGNR